ncbi:hypothetical protein PG993_014790 [Apiospora rasikravindrae]|uniref:Uncharacterized protein n=1 Tax=Apiospora rasikravindrae TaxID=990691 RepID=A0ABR1RNS2_9PEZI
MALRDHVQYASVPANDDPNYRSVKPQASRQGLFTPVKWKVEWKAPASMLFLFISGVLVTIAHHCFNSFFSGRDVEAVEELGSEFATQIWILRYGTAFAFLSKTLLASAVAIAYKQHIWITLGDRANSISTINVIFAATHDFLALLNPKLAMRAVTPALMALVIWCLPLAAVITPSTLLVISATRLDTSIQSVPTLNLRDSGLYTFSGLGTGGLSPLITRITTSVASNMEILPMPAIDNRDGMYQHEFRAPSMRCEAATGSRLQNMTGIWNATEKEISGSAGGQLQYLAYTLAEGPDGKPRTSYNATEYVRQCIAGENCPTSGGPAIAARLSDESIVCFVHNTTFKVQFAGLGRTQIITTYTFEYHEAASDGISQALARAITTILNGAIGAAMSGPVAHSGDSGASSLITIKTRIMETALIGLVSTAFKGAWGGPIQDLAKEDKLLARNRTLATMIEELSRNQTLSLFSSERLWSDNRTEVEVNHNIFYTKYEYQQANLLLSYGIAIGVSAACVLMGLRALWVNGVSHDTSFCSIMATTRNTSLDQLTLGHSVGAEPAPHLILDTRLRFGVLGNSGPGEDAASDQVVRAGFGLEKDVQPLRKGQVVY